MSVPTPYAQQRRYEFHCEACGEGFDLARPLAEAGDPAPCPFCGEQARRQINAPKLLLKADPNDVRPIWHNHGSFGHAHPPRRGRHPAGVDNH